MITAGLTVNNVDKSPIFTLWDVLQSRRNHGVVQFWLIWMAAVCISECVQLLYHCWWLCCIRQLLIVSIRLTNVHTAVHISTRQWHQIFTDITVSELQVAAVCVSMHKHRDGRLSLVQFLAACRQHLTGHLTVIRATLNLSHFTQVCHTSVFGMLAFDWRHRHYVIMLAFDWRHRHHVIMLAFDWWHRHPVIIADSYTAEMFCTVGCGWLRRCWSTRLNWRQTTLLTAATNSWLQS